MSKIKKDGLNQYGTPSVLGDSFLPQKEKCGNERVNTDAQLIYLTARHTTYDRWVMPNCDENCSAEWPVGKTLAIKLTANNKKLSYRGDSARCVKRSFKVTQGHLLLCQSTRHI